MSRKQQKIAEQLEMIEKRLASAEKYLARNINVEGTSWLHFDDWGGNSGHPLWVKNFMIPSMMKCRAKKEKAVKALKTKAKDKQIARRKQQPKTWDCEV